MSTQKRIYNRIKGKGRGSVFTPKDFLDLGSRASVDQGLSRLARDGAVTRLRRGVYSFPKKHPRLGTLLPTSDKVARALVGDAPLQISGAAAANALGLSTQVPARTVYYSDRSYADVPIGNRSISIRHAGPRVLAGANRPSGPVLQALKHIGRNRVNADAIRILRKNLPHDVKRDLRQFVQQNAHDVADWMIDPVDQITAGT